MKFFLLVFICLFNSCEAQRVTKVFSFITVPTRMVNYKPIRIGLTGDDLYDYLLHFENPNRSKITSMDSVMLWQMLSNINNDTTIWKWNELPNTFIIKDDTVDYKNIDKNSSLKDSMHEVLKFRKAIPCVYDQVSQEKLYSVSRPVFNKPRTLALVQYNQFSCKGEGNIDVRLYKKIKNNWIFIDYISRLRQRRGCSGVASIK